MGDIDRVKVLQKFRRSNSRRNVRMCLIFRKITLSQPRTVLMIEVLKYCDVLILGKRQRRSQRLMKKGGIICA